MGAGAIGAASQRRSDVEIEVIIVPGCGHCAAVQTLAHQVAEEFGISLKETNFLANPQRCLELGIETTPAIALDGEVIFRGVASKANLRRAVGSRLRRRTQ